MSTSEAIVTVMADKIRTVLAAVDGVDFQIEPLMVINPSPPCVDFIPGEPSNDPTMRAFGDEIGGELMTVRVRVSPLDHDASQSLLYALWDDEDPLSIILALQDESTLNGTVTSLDLQNRSSWAIFPVGDGESLIGFTMTFVYIKARS